MKKSTLLSLFSAIILTFGGCSESYKPLPSLHLKNKNYPNPEEISTLSFALAKPNFKVHTTLSRTLSAAFKEHMKYNTEKIACHLTGEINKILLSKGFTITQTFRSYNDMTFTQKRNTSALFFPEIIIDVEEKTLTDYVDNVPSATRGDLMVSARVNIIMLEPLSGEKIWVKSIPVDEISAPIEYLPNYEYGRGGSDAYTVPQELYPIATKLDNFFLKIDNDVIEATNKYVEQNEFEFLNDDIKRLKGIKRY